MPRPRLVRRRSRYERFKDYVNPLDWFLWASVAFETGDWDSKAAGTTTGLTLSFIFLIARSNSGRSKAYEDDVFSDYESGPGWAAWLASLVVWTLSLLSIFNAAYTFLRKRHYRLFENSIEVQPNTPSAKRVRVNSSPISSSPLRFLTTMIGESAQSRAYPDAKLDVWELAVWDPIPFCLRLFCLFSPGHVLVYWLFLPTHSMDPRPSTTVATTILLQGLLSLQLWFLQHNFSQQTKDTAVIHKEVLNEYDIKFVHPRLNPPVRDVGTQFTSSASRPEEDQYDSESEVDIGHPTTIIKREFRTNPNPNYAKHLSPDNVDAVPRRSVLTSNPAFVTPAQPSLRVRSKTPTTAIRQPQFRQSSPGYVPTSGGEGGSMGIYDHVNSPLRKASSMHDITRNSTGTPRNMKEMASREQLYDRERSRSPAKKTNQFEREIAARRLTDASMRGLGDRPRTSYSFVSDGKPNT